MIHSISNGTNSNDNYYLHLELFVILLFQAVIIMGSSADRAHCSKIQQVCEGLGLPCEVRVCSAHKSTEETLKLIAEYEGCGRDVVFIAVAGRSNGLGPVISGNSTLPVINCPPSSDLTVDIWSSLRVPSGKHIFKSPIETLP